jgi:hypothetical protein
MEYLGSGGSKSGTASLLFLVDEVNDNNHDDDNNNYDESRTGHECA